MKYMDKFFNVSTMYGILFVIISSLVISSCLKDPKSKDNKPIEFYNIILLLDLSDRILEPGQIQRDKLIIENLLDLFSNRQSSVGYQSLDEFSVNVAFQKGSNIDFSDISDDMRISMNLNTGRDKFNEEKENFLTAIDTIYDRAYESEKTGSDIWSFFRDYLSLLIKHPDESSNIRYQNKCIVITDGYLQFDRGTNRQIGTYMPLRDLNQMRRSSDWEKKYYENNFGFKPIEGIDFDNLQVAILEVSPVNPVENLNELPMLKLYWTDWFHKMGIQGEVYPKQENIKSINNKLIQFLKKNT